MIERAFEITLIGMGGVFFFLMFLICALHLLRILTVGENKNLSKIAAAIAWVKNKG